MKGTDAAGGRGRRWLLALSTALLGSAGYVHAERPAVAHTVAHTVAHSPDLPTGTITNVTVTGAQQSLLEELVLRAWTTSPAVLEAAAALDASHWRLSSEGRLAEALSITGSAGLSGDAYGQAAPRFAINLSLDLTKLAAPTGPAATERSALEARLTESRAQARLAVVAAFAHLLVARAAAEEAALVLEHSEAAFRVSEQSLARGVAAPQAALEARLAVSRAALGLLRANAEAVVALEALAALAGMPASDLLALVNAAN